ncbi:2-haloalkanoic acid dehalogenase, partial [Fusarium sp. NRRL 25303]
MTDPNRNVFFDVVGTLVSYEHLYEAIRERLGDKLIPRGIQPTLLGIFWLEMAKHDCCLHYAGVENPRSFATADLANEFKELKLRDGAA